MGMQSTGANCGFLFRNSSGTNIGKLFSEAGTLKFDSNPIFHGGNIMVKSSMPTTFGLWYNTGTRV
jgi:hypothetical protein